MSREHQVVTPVTLPPESTIARAYESTHLADAYSVDLPAGASTDPEQLARFIFSQQPAWINGLMTVRDSLVAAFGIKTAKHLASLGAEDRTGRVGIFKIYSRSKTEIVLGEDDKHLDFRLSVFCANRAALPGRSRLVLSTVVHCHNRLGRMYILLIAPFHRLVVQSSLRRAASIGWPPAMAAPAKAVTHASQTEV
ncbi:MAG: DUF2867 domain-containing protein [Burkholderiales bacterium]|nr:DUF2867 domain-containing protein [Burkholderiales bacterium]